MAVGNHRQSRISAAKDAANEGRCAFPEDAVSLAQHQRRGFRKVGIRGRIGRHHSTCLDVVLIERRGNLIG